MSGCKSPTGQAFIYEGGTPVQRWCPRCQPAGEWKALSAFAHDFRRKHSADGWCKPCRVRINSERYHFLVKKPDPISWDKSKGMPDIDALREWIDRAPMYPSGLVNCVTRNSRSVKGEMAGALDANGYYRVQLFGQNVGAHRLVWFLSTGRDPIGMEIDHIDGDPGNNRIENLRMATRAQNRQNTAGRGGTSSRFKGVHWVTQRKSWRASIRHEGHTYAFGPFDDEDEAARAYDAVALKFHGEFAHLNFPGEVA